MSIEAAIKPERALCEKVYQATRVHEVHVPIQMNNYNNLYLV